MRQLISLFVSSLLSCTFSLAGTPRKEAVSIQFGQPTVWTLEQAHYLLEKNRETNLALRSKSPSELDANAIHGSRISLLRTLLQVSSEYNSRLNLETQVARQRLDSNLQIRSALANRQQKLREERIQLVDEIAELRLARAQLNASNSTEVVRSTKDEEIKASETNLSKKDAEYTALSTEIAALDAKASGLTDSSTGSVAGTLPGANIDASVVKELFSSAVNDPKLAASVLVDNHIQLQYELVAKQLTLLRDEVGPERRVLFLELPQSLYTVPGQADEVLIRTWWKISSFVVPVANLSRPKTDQEKEAQRQCESFPLTIEEVLARTDGTPWSKEPNKTRYKETTDFRRMGLSRLVDGCEQFEPKFIRQENRPELLDAHALELVPRLGSLNVTDIQGTINASNWGGAIKAFLGFGVKVDYQRQKELYEQYVHQEIFASSFGKGDIEFGWTFGALPGQKRVAPGSRTTYAVVVIPRDAVALELIASGSFYDRKGFPPTQFGGAPRKGHTTEGSRTFFLRVPQQQEEFFVESAYYTSVHQGQRISVVLEGWFSPQTGVLINGTPLQPTVRLADVAAEPCGGAASGRYELVNSGQLTMSFCMGPDFVGTPTITLVSPAKTAAINYFIMNVQARTPYDEQGNHACGDKKTTLASCANKLPMLRLPLAIREVLLEPGLKGDVNAAILGTGFRSGAVIEVNGTQVSSNNFQTSARYRATFERPESGLWTVALFQHDSNEERGTFVVSDPLPPVFDQKQQLPKYLPPEKGKEKDPPKLEVTVLGRYFQADQEVQAVGAKKESVLFISTKKLIVLVSDPAARFTVQVFGRNKKLTPAVIEFQRP